jgi:glutathione synthase/RimK-type ligase-like ATP-grasp enzyme
MSDDDLSEIKVDVGVLKTQVLTLSALCNKMDQVIEKLVDQHDRHINKVYDTMAEQRKDTDEEVADVHLRIDTVLDKLTESEVRIMNEIKSLKGCLNEHSAQSKLQFEKINQWKWMIAGGIVVVSWLISHGSFDTILKSLH